MASGSPIHLAVALELAAAKNLSNVSFTAEGAFKETYRAESGGNPIALKILDPAKCDLARSAREIEAMQRCNSPFIARLFDSGTFQSSSGANCLFSIEEYLDGGTLSSRMTANAPMAIDTVKLYGRSLSEALDHLRGLNLVHRDIKPDNIMFRAGVATPVLVDFGLVRDLSEISLTQTWLPQGPGTPYYASPEQLRNQKALIGWRTDQFSLGIVLGILLTAQHPFARPGMTPPQTVTAVASRQPCAPEFVTAISKLGLSEMIRMLASWPVNRYADPRRLLEIFK